MSATRAFRAAQLRHVFNNENIADIGDSTGLRGSTTPGNIYLSFHSADPTTDGSQNSNEISYGGYERIPLDRDDDIEVNNTACTATTVAPHSFPQCESGSATATYLGVGTEASGAGTLLFRKQLDSPIAITAGFTPTIPAGTLVFRAPEV